MARKTEINLYFILIHCRVFYGNKTWRDTPSNYVPIPDADNSEDYD